MAYMVEAEPVRAEEQLERARAADMPYLDRRSRTKEYRRLYLVLEGRGSELGQDKQARWDAAWGRLRRLPGVSAAGDTTAQDPRLARRLGPGERVVVPES